jgi:antitoxin (DNA-binding transcriptional repressor) of toxin-antitoxin stability system
MTRRRSRPASTAVAVTLAVLLGLLGGCERPRARYAGIASTVSTRAQSGADAVRDFRSPRRYRPTAVPVRLQIPSIGVDTGLQRLGRDVHGAVDVPKGRHKWDMAGWYAGEGGTRPGDPGSAVLLGHVDSTSGPAVFYRLRELRPGDQVEVVRADRTVARFTVDRVEQYPKARFPTDDVYYPTMTPKLRLVTCGGSFDPLRGHYRSNVIVFASLSR